MAVAGNGKIGPINRLATPVWWLYLLQTIAKGRSAIAVQSNILVAFFCWSLSDIYVGKSVLSWDSE